MRFSISRLGRQTEGNVAVMFAFAAVPLIALIGGGVDFARTIDARQQLQSAVDTAVLAGVTQTTNSKVTKATQVFQSTFNVPWAKDVTSNFVANADGSVTGTASANVGATIMKVLRKQDLAVNVTAKAKIGSGADVCILLLAPSTTQALLVNSGAKLTASTCEIHDSSTASPAAIFNAGSTLNVSKVCIKGGNIINNGGTVPVETNCTTITDPFAGKLPAVSVPGTCSTPGPYNGGSSVTLNAGNYCNISFGNYTTINLNPGMLQNINFNGTPTVNLSAGLYIIKGTVTFNSGAKVNGTGVTFYFADANSKIQFNGNVTANVSAPTSGTYSDILFFEPTGLSKTQWPINGTSGSGFTGPWYLPSRDVTINSVSNATMDKATMVFNTLILNNTNWTFESSAKKMTAGGSGTSGVYLVN